MKTRIKELRQKAGITQEEVANRLGIHLTNYSRLETGKTELTASKMEQLAKILGCNPSDFVSSGDLIPTSTRQVDVISFVQAGNWACSNELEPEDQFPVAVPHDPVWDKYNLTGVEVRGPSMNQRYPEGTVLVITDMIQTKEDIQIGKRYIVERERADGEREYTVKTLHQDEEGQYWLLPESSDPRHQAPIKANGDEGDTVRLLGRVVYSLIRED